jgi:hypothetical protein
MFNPVKFIKYFFISSGAVGSVFILYYFLALLVGEVNIDRVIEKQITSSDTKNILFRSGLNQFAFSYKTKMMKKVKPRVVVLGSSRSMQVREQFFEQKFINLGGAIQGVTDLEDYVDFLDSNSLMPDLTILFLDPWWFNGKTSERGGMHQLDYPTGVSIDHLLKSLTLLKKGNWIKASFQNEHMGIAAILTQEGFSRDGSNNYTKYVSSEGMPTDIKFQHTLKRIENNNFPFQITNHPSPHLIKRACMAIKKINLHTNNLTLVAPPFAPTIWNLLSKDPKYSYINEAYEELEACLQLEIHDYMTTNNTYDCEFIDGFHGGDTSYARIILDLFVSKNIDNGIVDEAFLQTFIQNESGFASGFTRHQSKDFAEVDFLKLGCSK